MSYEYNFDKIEFLNGIISPGRLSQEIGSSTISIALDHLDISSTVCGINFKAELSPAEQTTLSGIVVAHTGAPLQTAPPTMTDGRPIVRADTRPLGTQTWFTSAGDCDELLVCEDYNNCLSCEKGPGIGSGKPWRWNFSNYDDEYDPSTLENPIPVVSGYRYKLIHTSFAEPIYIKDGTLYFLDATYGTYLSMFVTVPSGNFYPNSTGPYPASALGLSGDQMYAYATKDVFYICYVNRQYMIGDCPMGDELNAEGTSVTPIPAGWHISGLVVTTEDNTSFKGHGSLETYRENTAILPGGAWNGEYSDETQ